MAETRPRRPSWQRLLDRALARYALALLFVAVTFLLRKALEPATGAGAPFMLFFGAVVLTGLVLGAGPAIVVTLVSAPLAANVFVVRAGFTPVQATVQAIIFVGECGFIVYASSLMRRARRAAELAGEWLELANEAADIASWDLDVASGRLRWSADAMALLGVAGRESRLGECLGLIHPEDREAFAEACTRSLDPAGAGELRCEARLVRGDGVRWFSFVGRTYFSAGVAARVAVRQVGAAVDITESHRRDDERQVFVSLLENSSDFIGIAAADGTPIWINPAGRKLVGLPADLPVEQTRTPDYYPRAERDFAAGVIGKSVSEQGRWSGETWFRNWQTGEAIPVSDEQFMIRDATGRRVLGIGTVARNISEPRRVMDRLRESEERFRLTIDEAPIGMALVAIDGHFVRVNRRLCEITGYSAEELEHKTFQDITHPDDVDHDVALSHQLACGEIPRCQLEKRYVRKDGEIVTIMLTASLLRARDGAPQHFIAQIEDISERKRAEQALRFSEARFSGIIDISADAIVSIDEQHRITLFNRGAEEIFGYARAEVMGEPVEILVPERLRALHREGVVRFASGPMTAIRMGGIVGRRKSGEEFPADATMSRLQLDGRVVLTIALRDVTALKRVERQQRFLADAGALLSSSLDYEQTLATVGQLLVRDFADWCIVDVIERDERPRRFKVVSAAAERASLCAELEQLTLDRSRPHLGHTALERRRPQLVQRFTAKHLEAVAQSKEHLRLLRALDPRSVIEVPLSIRGQLLGVLVLVSSTPGRFYDVADLRFAEAISERAALAIENGRLYQQALHATRLRDEVLGVVAHDLRNPVSSILLQSQMMRRQGGEPERRDQKANQVIQRAARRMNRLIRDLLDVSAIEAGQLGIERARIAPNELLFEAQEAQRALAASGSLELLLDVRSELPEIAGDAHRLLRVLENLIGNATRFTPGGGRITVGASPREGDVLFWVADTGCGIGPEVLPHIFDRFWRFGERRGTGLGLAISRGIIEAHGGRIWVESAPGRGSTFYFTVPQAPRPGAVRPAAPA